MIEPKQYFFYRQEGILKKIDLEDVLFMGADKNYTRFYTIHSGTPIIVRSNLDGVLKRLPENWFLRIHRSFAVSGDYLIEVARDHVKLLLYPHTIPVSKQYYAVVIKKLVIFNSSSAKAKFQQNLPGNPLTRDLSFPGSASTANTNIQ